MVVKQAEKLYNVFLTLALFEKGQTLTSPTFEGLGVEVVQVFAE